MHAMPAEHRPHGHACDACGTGVMRQTEGVHPGVGRGYGDHERLLRRRELDLARLPCPAAALPGSVRFRLMDTGSWAT